MKKEIIIVVLVIALFVSFTYNIHFLILIDNASNQLDKSSDALNYALSILNSTKEQLLEQYSAIENLTIMNIAWSLYAVSGNESWLPQNYSDIDYS